MALGVGIVKRRAKCYPLRKVKLPGSKENSLCCLRIPRLRCRQNNHNVSMHVNEPSHDLKNDFQSESVASGANENLTEYDFN